MAAISMREDAFESYEENSWEGLSPDLLDIIVRKLSGLDADRFSAVCASWRGVMKASRVSYRPFRLTVSPNTSGIRSLNGSYGLSLRVGSFLRGKLSQRDSVLPLNEHYHNSLCAGSSKNMLVLQDMFVSTEIVLLNPFSLETVRLPSLATLYSIRKDYNIIANIGLFLEPIFIHRAVILVKSEKMKMRNDEPDLVLAVIYTSETYSGVKSIAYCHVGSWAELDQSQDFEDIVARDRRLFVLSGTGLIEGWDFGRSGSDAKPVRKMCFVPSEALPVKLFWEDPFERRYLVIESMEILFLVKRLYDFDYSQEKYKTVEFHVYKSQSGSRKSWVKVESIGDDIAFFLGYNESALVSSSDFPAGCEGNSIYFCDEYDTGVYNLANNTIEFCVHNNEQTVYWPSVWMVKI